MRSLENLFEVKQNFCIHFKCLNKLNWISNLSEMCDFFNIKFIYEV